MPIDGWELIERARVKAATSAGLIERGKATIATSEELLRLTDDMARANEAFRRRYDAIHSWRAIRSVLAL
jgi:hypothetical protein